jgi:diguanylate cyclase (GGDEF)-like protein
VNDEHGHDIGDRTIRAVGDQLRSVLRTSDTVGRWGGEEFLVLLPETDAVDAAALAERMRVTIARAGLPLANGRPVTISLGVSAVTFDQAQSAPALFEAALKLADNALYRAKHSGRNRVVSGMRLEMATPLPGR